LPKVKVPHTFNEIYFFTEAQINITVTTPVFLTKRVKILKVRRAVIHKRAPKKRKRGFHDTA